MYDHLPSARGKHERDRDFVHPQRGKEVSQPSRPTGGEEVMETSIHRGVHNWVVFLRLGNLTFVNFGLLSALGGAVSMWWILARQIQAGLDPERFAPLVYFAGPILIVLGSRLFGLVQQWEDFKRAPLETLRKPRFTFHGGFFGGAAAVIYVAAVYEMNLFTFLDTFALAIPVGHALGRMGCYTYGCCYGRPTERWPAVCFTNPESKAVWKGNMLYQ